MRRVLAAVGTPPWIGSWPSLTRISPVPVRLTTSVSGPAPPYTDRVPVWGEKCAPVGGEQSAPIQNGARQAVASSRERACEAMARVLLVEDVNLAGAGRGAVTGR